MKNKNIIITSYIIYATGLAIALSIYGAALLKWALIPLGIHIVYFTIKFILLNDAWNQYDFMDHQRKMKLEFQDEEFWNEEDEELKTH